MSLLFLQMVSSATTVCIHNNCVCIFCFCFVSVLTLDWFIVGGFNMGGEPDPTVAKIKNMVYMNHTVGSPKNESRDDYLGEYSFHLLRSFVIPY